MGHSGDRRCLEQSLLSCLLSRPKHDWSKKA